MTAATETATLAPGPQRWGLTTARPAAGRHWTMLAALRVLVAGFVLLAAGAAVYADSLARDDAVSAATGDARLVARVAAAELATGLARLDADVARTAATPGLDSRVPAAGCAVSPEPGGFATARVDVIRADGAVVCSSRASSVGHRDAPSAWMTRARSGPVLVGPVADPVTGRPVLVRAMPATGGGVVAGIVGLHDLGRGLAARFAGRHLELALAGPGARHVAATSGSGVVGARFDRADRLWGAAPVAGTGWTVHAGADRAVALASAHRVFDRELWIVVAGVAAILLLAFLGHWYVTRPIRRLTLAVRAATVDPAVARRGCEPVAARGPVEVADLFDAVDGLVQAGARRNAGESVPPAGSPDRRIPEPSSGVPVESEPDFAYRLIFETSPQPMWIHDIDTLELLAVNDAAVAQYGYSRAELLAMSVRDVVVPDACPARPQRLTSGSASARSGPWKHRRRDGSHFEVEVRARTLSFGGRPACCISAADVTQRQRREGQAVAAQQMDSLGRLAAGLAHDFNNLLAVIVSYSDFIAEDIERAARGPEGEVWLSIQEDIVEIQSAAARAGRITDGLLTFAHRASGSPQVFEPNAFVADLEPALRRIAGDGVTLQLSFGRAVRPVSLDPQQLEQVLLSLVVNACDAMPDGGNLTIDTATVEVHDAASTRHEGLVPGAYVRFRVVDSGVGMDDVTLVHAFEPFFTTKSAGEGIGLGLATVHGLVTAAGGRVWIDSDRSAGTTVTALFPSAEVAALV